MATTKNKAGSAAAAAGAIALAVSIAAPAEGYVAYVYKDPIGILTYCYGETQNAKGMQGKKFSEAECRALLVKRMAHYDQGNADCTPNWSSLPVEVRGAFNSFSYNLGNAAYCKSTAAKYLRTSNVKAACMEMGKFVRAGGKVLKGLVTRRATEQMMCLRGIK
jgi:lysozyme